MSAGTDEARVFVTGGAGFIGSSVVRFLIEETRSQVLNLDKLTYAGNLESLTPIAASKRYRFVKGDIANRDLVERLLDEFRPSVIMHLAAESHVDRSIDGPSEFVHTNIVGTSVLLEATRLFWEGLPRHKKEGFRFHHISTDEVYGSLGADGLFREDTPYDPSSPYSASKASSDHLVRAWHRTYGLPALVTNCSNNYGPYQFPEKLIPLVIINALEGKRLPIYGDGGQVRDWLYVEDHARALYRVVKYGEVGETYNIGSHSERTNLDVVRAICALLDELRPNKPNGIQTHDELITFVPDRPGHDRRYAIDSQKIQSELGWGPQETFESGLAKTVRWYLSNRQWWRHILSDDYHGQRLGLRRSSKRLSEAGV